MTSDTHQRYGLTSRRIGRGAGGPPRARGRERELARLADLVDQSSSEFAESQARRGIDASAAAALAREVQACSALLRFESQQVAHAEEVLSNVELELTSAALAIARLRKAAGLEEARNEPG